MSEEDAEAGDPRMPDSATPQHGSIDDPRDAPRDRPTGTGARRYGSPRTPELPRAFTLREFVEGAARALFWFQPFAAATSLIIGVVVAVVDSTMPGYRSSALPMVVPFLFVSACYGIPVSVGAAVLFSPLAHRLGRRLEHVARDRVHVVAFAILGVVVGVLTAVLFGLGWVVVTGAPWSSAFGWALYVCLYVPPSAVAVPLGWWGASRRALKEDEEREARTTASAASGPIGDDGSR